MAATASCTAPVGSPARCCEAGCFAHARRKFFELADVEGAARKKSRGERTGTIYPIALEAVQRLDALFEIERTINGKPAAERLAVRHELSAPLMAELHTWLTAQLAKLSRNHDLAKAINYMLRRWEAFTRFLDDGRVCLIEQRRRTRAALRASRPQSLAVLRLRPRRPARRRPLHADPDRQAQRRRPASLARRRARPHRRPSAARLDELLPWNWRRHKPRSPPDRAAAFGGRIHEDLRAEAFDLIRSLIDEVVMTPRAGGLHAEIKGELAVS